MALCSISTPSIIYGFYGFLKLTSKVLCSYLTVSIALNYEFIHRFEARDTETILLNFLVFNKQVLNRFTVKKAYTERYYT